MAIDLSINPPGLTLANPTLTCFGTGEYAFEYADYGLDRFLAEKVPHALPRMSLLELRGGRVR